MDESQDPEKPKRKRGRPKKDPAAELAAKTAEPPSPDVPKNAIYFLTPAELRFAQAKATGQTDEDAIRAAGYRGDSGRARVRAHRLMKRPVVRAAVYELAARAMTEAGIEVTQVMREYAFLAFMPPEMIEGKPKWSDKRGALDRLGDYLKLFNRASPEGGGGPKTLLQLIVQAGQQLTVKDGRGNSSTIEAVPMAGGAGSVRP
jgi:hypothetical protein